jgi:cell pole-organizing protein PopZ
MAQANSIQREPSMEEILASIRRIIEDSDTARKVLDDEEAIAPAEAQPELQAEVEVQAFREELSAEQPAKPVSLAQIQAEVARGPRLDQIAVREAWSRPASPMRDPEPETARPEPHRQDHEELDMDEPSVEEKSAAQAENQNPRPAILSEHATRQIAASFGELSEAFAATRRKSFDQMAEDMLRPMLQDWLDNNLPLLVENLVREEIERVARGGAG